MRQDPDFFGDQDLVLIFVAKRLKVALALEKVLDAGEFDYAVVPAHYTSGLLFRSERIGAFFYVTPDVVPRARVLMLAHGFRPCEESPGDSS